MMKKLINREKLYEITGSTSHYEFEEFLRKSLLDKKIRTEFYTKMSEEVLDLSIDSFRGYFEEYAAERKSNQQDYTPDEVARLGVKLLNQSSDGSPMNSKYRYGDVTAGTGALLITAWDADRKKVTPFDYYPHNYVYYAEEKADNVIPYLLHNLAFRGMNAIVVHGDTLERIAKQVYFIQNSSDDPFDFSDINVFKHNSEVEKEFNIKSWSEEEIDYIESQRVIWRGISHGLSNAKEARV